MQLHDATSAPLADAPRPESIATSAASSSVAAITPLGDAGYDTGLLESPLLNYLIVVHLLLQLSVSVLQPRGR